MPAALALRAVPQFLEAAVQVKSAGGLGEGSTGNLAGEGAMGQHLALSFL